MDVQITVRINVRPGIANVLWAYVSFEPDVMARNINIAISHFMVVLLRGSNDEERYYELDLN